jgi:alcohol dehydrogenase class IV
MVIISRIRISNIPIIAPLLLTTIRRTQIIYSAVTAASHVVEALLSTISSPLTRLHSLQTVDKIPAILPQPVANKYLDVIEQLSSASISTRTLFSNARPDSGHLPVHKLRTACEEVW